jgi:alpha-ketoglutarate-dependent taurine dioxygenase
MEPLEQTTVVSSGAKPFRQIRRKIVDLGTLDLVKTSNLRPENSLPLVLQPAVPGVDLGDWARENWKFLEEKLLEHGAILFRDFGLTSVADFEKAALAMCPDLFAEYGDLPREGVSDKVYSSTPYPADEMILFHNESSHLPQWPRKQFFFCVQPSREGGETPLLDCRRVYMELAPEVRDQFATKGLIYVRNFVPGIDVPWQEFFHTSDHAAVESTCLAEGMECEWTAGGGLRVRQRARAIIRHSKTGELVFFNQVQLHHPSCLNAAVRESLAALFREEERPRNVCYGDGTPIEDEVMEQLGALYSRLAVEFHWQAGDLIFVENMLVAHARNPFVGPRKICVAMGDMVRDRDLLALNPL